MSTNNVACFVVIKVVKCLGELLYNLKGFVPNMTFLLCLFYRSTGVYLFSLDPFLDWLKMGKMLSKIFGKKDMRILMLGLDAAGKTSILSIYNIYNAFGLSTHMMLSIHVAYLRVHTCIVYTLLYICTLIVFHRLCAANCQEY